MDCYWRKYWYAINMIEHEVNWVVFITLPELMESHPYPLKIAAILNSFISPLLSPLLLKEIQTGNKISHLIQMRNFGTSSYITDSMYLFYSVVKLCLITSRTKQ